MTVAHSRFAKLLELAETPSSEKRRDLLREVTDLFFENENQHNVREAALFDEVMRTVAADLEDSVLADMADRLARANDAPPHLMRDLAERTIAVAGPVLRHSTVLTDDDLEDLIARRGQEHVRAIAARAKVSERLSDVITSKGDDETLSVLVSNEGAEISRASMETIVDRAKQNEAMHARVVHRKDLPIDLMNEMYFVVAGQLRAKILERNSSVSPQELDEALERARKRMLKTQQANDAAEAAAAQYVLARKTRGELKPALLVALLRDQKRPEFIHGLAEMVGLEPATTRALVEGADLDALAMACRAANLDRPLFVTLAVLICGGEAAMGRAEDYGKLYSAVPVEAAQRAMRFFKVRKGAGQHLAA